MVILSLLALIFSLVILCFFFPFRTPARLRLDRFGFDTL